MKNIRPQDKYNKEHRRTHILAVYVPSEQDIEDKLNDVKNKNGYVKELIRDDIKKKRNILKSKTEVL
jgi:hypothetical protein